MENDDWKYKELPRASGKIAPAEWNPSKSEWLPYTTNKPYVRHSSKGKPTNAIEGETLIFYDTKQVFILDDEKNWREIS